MDPLARFAGEGFAIARRASAGRVPDRAGSEVENGQARHGRLSATSSHRSAHSVDA